MATAEKSMIPKGMVIEGDVIMDGDLDLVGEIRGNVTATNLVVTGAIKGDLNVDQRVDIENGAMVMGSIAAGEINVALGAICEIKMEKFYTNPSAAQFFSEYLKNHKPATADDVN
ncbi:MAG: polymer-forming cytoskeletal protein [Lachnospiraceae bacterium]|nr:polymer-forming cytoskeletal protein [Lachnospiraceae bacterium]